MAQDIKKEKVFADGMYFDRNDNAPVYVIGCASFKVAQFIKFLQTHETNAGYVNVDIKQSQKGSYYCELNQWKPIKDKVKEEEKNQEDLNNLGTIEYPEGDSSEEIPF